MTTRIEGHDLRAECELCGILSPPNPPSSRGEIDVWHLPPGWSVAPYEKSPDRYVCADCNIRRAS